MPSSAESFKPNGGKDDCLDFLVSARALPSEMVRHIRKMSAQSGWSPVTMAIRLGFARYRDIESARELELLVRKQELTSDVAIIAYAICSRQRCSVQTAIEEARLNWAIANSSHVSQ